MSKLNLYHVSVELDRAEFWVIAKDYESAEDFVKAEYRNGLEFDERDIQIHLAYIDTPGVLKWDE